MSNLSTKPNRFYPSIPGITQEADTHTNALQILKEAVETHERRNNNYLKSFIRFEELVDLGLINVDGSQNEDFAAGGGVPEAPIDGSQYGREDGGWTLVTAGSSTFAALTDTDTAGLAIYHMLFWDGSDWVPTADLKWDGSRLQIANDLSIDWLNASATSIELLRFLHVSAVPGDDNWTEVQFLAKFEGADAATSYTELSPNAAVAVFYDDAQIDTAQFKFGTSSILLDGDGDYVEFPDISAYDLGTADWTVEGFVRLNTLPVGVFSSDPGFSLCSLWGALSGDKLFSFELNHDSFGYKHRLRFDGTSEVSGTRTYVVNTWYHWAVTRTGGQMRAYFDGNYTIGDFGGAPADMGGSSEPLRIGSLAGADNWHDGWIDNVRLTIGTARYTGTGSYTIPTSDFGVVQSSPEQDIFTVGDPGYITNIEGSEIHLNGVPIEENATHTGEVTGDHELTLDVTAVTNRTDVVADSADDVAIHDDSDGTFKKVNLSSITDAGYF